MIRPPPLLICQEGVPEIKCPYSINGEVITSKEVHEIDLDFMVMHQRRATLNPKHKYPGPRRDGSFRAYMVRLCHLD